MKKSLELEKKVFQRKFEKLLNNFCVKLRDYSLQPNNENIHDIRVAVRRLENAHRILPKSIRRKKSIKNYIVHAKLLFKLNAHIRDIDIICAKFEIKYRDQTRNLVQDLQQQRISRLQEANKIASTLSHLDSLKIPWNEIKKTSLCKRYHKIIHAIILDIKKNSAIALSDEKKIEELHRVRKDFKKLRYSLELISNRKAVELRNLRQIQDILGEIHDYDIMINYLKSLTDKYQVVHVLESEISERRKKYNLFISSFSKMKSDLF